MPVGCLINDGDRERTEYEKEFLDQLLHVGSAIFGGKKKIAIS